VDLLTRLGALAKGLAILRPDLLALGSAQHIWMAGGFALMTLAVMIRATLAIFAALVAAVLARLCAGIWEHSAMPLYTLSAALWIGAFLGFAVLYGSSLLRPKAA